MKPIPDIPLHQFNDHCGDGPYDDYFTRDYYRFVDEVERPFFVGTSSYFCVFIQHSFHSLLMGIHLP